MAPTPEHVKREAKRPRVAVTTAMPKECAPLQKEAQADCRARLLIVALRRSEGRKDRALKDAVNHIEGAEAKYGTGGK